MPVEKDCCASETAEDARHKCDRMWHEWLKLLPSERDAGIDSRGAAGPDRS